jgi:hypothetical protein
VRIGVKAEKLEKVVFYFFRLDHKLQKRRSWQLNNNHGRRAATKEVRAALPNSNVMAT